MNRTDIRNLFVLKGWLSIRWYVNICCSRILSRKGFLGATKQGSPNVCTGDESDCGQEDTGTEGHGYLCSASLWLRFNTLSGYFTVSVSSKKVSVLQALVSVSCDKISHLGAYSNCWLAAYRNVSPGNVPVELGSTAVITSYMNTSYLKISNILSVL